MYGAGPPISASRFTRRFYTASENESSRFARERNVDRRREAAADVAIEKLPKCDRNLHY